jgi:hypothetical protein
MGADVDNLCRLLWISCRDRDFHVGSESSENHHLPIGTRHLD